MVRWCARNRAVSCSSYPRRSDLGAGAKVITAEERMHKGQANVANIRAMLAKAKEKG